MSFGFSISDFVSLTQLAWHTVQNARHACGAHDELYREVNSLYIVLQRLRHEADKSESLINLQDDSRQEELDGLLRGCTKVLKTLAQILEKYNGLSDEKRRVTKLWQRIKFGNNEMVELSTLRLQLSTHTNAITLFLNLLSLGSQGKVEQHMRSHGEDLRQLQHSVNWLLASQQGAMKEGSVFTSYDNDDKLFWRELRRELVKEGFSSSTLHKYKSLIKDYVVELGNRGALDDPDQDLRLNSETDQDPNMLVVPTETEIIADKNFGDHFKVSHSKISSSNYQKVTVEEVDAEDSIRFADHLPPSVNLDFGSNPRGDDGGPKPGLKSEDQKPSVSPRCRSTDSSNGRISGEELGTSYSYTRKTLSCLHDPPKSAAVAEQAQTNAFPKPKSPNHASCQYSGIALAGSIVDCISLAEWLRDTTSEYPGMESSPCMMARNRHQELRDVLVRAYDYIAFLDQVRSESSLMNDKVYRLLSNIIYGINCQFESLIAVLQRVVSAAEKKVFETIQERAKEDDLVPTMSQISSAWYTHSVQSFTSQERCDLMLALSGSEWSDEPLRVVVSGLKLWLFQFHDCSATPFKHLIERNARLSYNQRQIPEWETPNTWAYLPWHKEHERSKYWKLQPLQVSPADQLATVRDLATANFNNKLWSIQCPDDHDELDWNCQSCTLQDLETCFRLTFIAKVEEIYRGERSELEDEMKKLNAVRTELAKPIQDLFPSLDLDSALHHLAKTHAKHPYIQAYSQANEKCLNCQLRMRILANSLPAFLAYTWRRSV